MLPTPSLPNKFQRPLCLARGICAGPRPPAHGVHATLVPPVVPASSPHSGRFLPSSHAALACPPRAQSLPLPPRAGRQVPFPHSLGSPGTPRSSGPPKRAARYWGAREKRSLAREPGPSGASRGLQARVDVHRPPPARRGAGSDRPGVRRPEAGPGARGRAGRRGGPGLASGRGVRPRPPARIPGCSRRPRSRRRPGPLRRVLGECAARPGPPRGRPARARTVRPEATPAPRRRFPGDAGAPGRGWEGASRALPDPGAGGRGRGAPSPEPGARLPPAGCTGTGPSRGGDLIADRWASWDGGVFRAAAWSRPR